MIPIARVKQVPTVESAAMMATMRAVLLQSAGTASLMTSAATIPQRLFALQLMPALPPTATTSIPVLLPTTMEVRATATVPETAIMCRSLFRALTQTLPMVLTEETLTLHAVLCAIMMLTAAQDGRVVWIQHCRLREAAHPALRTAVTGGTVGAAIQDARATILTL
ncbi:MAG: hypothetical protein D6698_15950 [Gammaproteobacteria bacterium]|nr:MAG: hypothetical protein D6698_15950 [Gammaproteobacteria bacterium]